jgi:ZIP family zinc transporter
VLSALLFGMIASSALVIGSLVGAYLRPPERLVAVALAFATVTGFFVSFAISEL